MTEKARIYGRVLCELNLDREIAEKMLEVFKANPILIRVLSSPAVDSRSKNRVIRKIFCQPDFPDVITAYVEKACSAGCADRMEEVGQVYRSCLLKKDGIAEAELYCVTKPTEEEIRGLEDFLCRRLGKKEARITVVPSPGLLGGFLLKADGKEYDYSLKGQLETLAKTIAG